MAEESVYLTAFRQGLADVGYVEGRNIVVEHRFPAEKPELFQSMAAELVGLKPNVLVAAGQPPALALQRATTSIPIVFVAAYDPIAVGLVTNLARPSGNVTGLSFPDLIRKRLELFRQALPNLSRVAVLINAADQTYVQRYARSLQQDGQNLGMGIQTVEVNGTGDIERAFSTIHPDSGTGVAAAADVMFYNEPIIDLALTIVCLQCSTTKNSSKPEVFYPTAPTSRKFSAALPFMRIKSSRAPSPSICRLSNRLFSGCLPTCKPRSHSG
jgi:ABC transporter substrate binding protein